MWAGAARSALPVSRRKRDANGRVLFAPNRGGAVCDHLPICFLWNVAGECVALLFSVSCHPSSTSGLQISADYPGVAMKRLDSYLGSPCSLFLQGMGGDAEPSVVARGEQWVSGTWDDIARGGRIVAQEVIQALQKGLAPMEPEIQSCSIETEWALEPAPDRSGYKVIESREGVSSPKRLWAERQIERFDRAQVLPKAVKVTLHGLQLGKGLRLIGIEGEAVAELGLLMLSFYDDGITFPLGYTNGAQLYLPTTPMLDEGGYEVESYWEYGLPAPLTKGTEDILRDGLRELRACGVE